MPAPQLPWVLHAWINSELGGAEKMSPIWYVKERGVRADEEADITGSSREMFSPAWCSVVFADFVAGWAESAVGEPGSRLRVAALGDAMVAEL